MSEKIPLYLALGGTFIIGSIAIGGVIYLGIEYKNTIPEGKDLQDGFVNPSNLEIKLTDEDLNKRNEVIMEYEGKKYLMKYDSENNEVKLVQYTVKGPKIIERE